MTPAEIDQMREALRDMLAGWKYIRSFHGDLYGVGWDRAQGKAEAALAASPPPPAAEGGEARDAALAKYADPANWAECETTGLRRVWLEPDSNTPDAYHGYEHARAAIAATPTPPAAEPTADAKDAARYRWLRERDWIDDAIMEHNGIKEFEGETLDAAIDAALSKGAGND